MAFQTLNFSNKMSSRISLEIKFWITFNTGPETRNFQGASAQIQLAQKGSIFPKKSLIFISKMAILGSFRGGSEVAFVTSAFFALSSVTYWSSVTWDSELLQLHPVPRRPAATYQLPEKTSKKFWQQMAFQHLIFSNEICSRICSKIMF